MAHITLSGVPTELHQAAIDALAHLIEHHPHTGEVQNEQGTRIFGTDPAPPAEEPAQTAP